MNINTAFPSKYLKAGDLDGKAVPVTIREVKIEEVGKSRDSKPVIYFMGKEKGVVLNRVNSKKIAEIAGSNDTEDWGGTMIVLFPTETDFAGETVECIRVRAPKTKVAPKPEPVFTGVDGSDDDIQF